MAELNAQNTQNIAVDQKKEEIKQTIQEEKKQEIAVTQANQKPAYTEEYVQKLQEIAKKVEEKAENKKKKKFDLYKKSLKEDSPSYFKDEVILTQTAEELVNNKKSGDFISYLLEKHKKQLESSVITNTVVTQKKKEDVAIQQANNVKQEVLKQNTNHSIGEKQITNDVLDKINANFFSTQKLDDLIRSLAEKK